MKLNIVMTASDVRVGYRNVYDRANLAEGMPVGHESAEQIWVPNIGDLGQLCLPGEADEVLVQSLDRVPVNLASQFLDHWVSRTAIGGLIAVSSVDLFEVAAFLTMGSLQFEQAVGVLYGTTSPIYRSYSIEQLCEALSGRGVSITQRRHENLRAWAVGVRK